MIKLVTIAMALLTLSAAIAVGLASPAFSQGVCREWNPTNRGYLLIRTADER